MKPFAAPILLKCDYTPGEEFVTSSLGQLTMQTFALDRPNLVSFLAPATYFDSAALFIAGLVSLTIALRKYTWDKPGPITSGTRGRKRRTERNPASRKSEILLIFWKNW